MEADLMARTPTSFWPKGIGFAVGGLLLASIFSFYPQDPTLVNLRLPSGGVRNMVGLAGALSGGSLVEFLGSTSLLAPLLFLNWFTTAHRMIPGWVYSLYSVITLLSLSSLHGVLQPLKEPGLTSPGLVGLAGRAWVETIGGMAGFWLGLAIYALVGAAGLWWLVRVSPFNGAQRNGGEWLWEVTTGIRMGFSPPESGSDPLQPDAESMEAVDSRSATYRPLRQRVAARVQALIYAPHRMRRWWHNNRPSPMRRIKTRQSPVARRSSRTDVQSASQGASGSGNDHFETWMEPRPPPTSALAGEGTNRAISPVPSPAEMPLEGTEERTGMGRESPREQKQGSVAKDTTKDIAKEPAQDPAVTAAEEAVKQESLGETLRQPQSARLSDPASEPPSSGDGRAESREHPLNPEQLDYRFESPEAEKIWHRQFQRYTQTADLDWYEQPWRRRRKPEKEEDDPLEGFSARDVKPPKKGGKNK